MTKLHTLNFLGSLKTRHVSSRSIVLESLVGGYLVTDFRSGELGCGAWPGQLSLRI